MGESTNISWTDHSWSPWYGCTQVSIGPCGACEHCYARQQSEIRFHRVIFGRAGVGIGTRSVRADQAWKDPPRWNRQAAEARRAWSEGPSFPQVLPVARPPTGPPPSTFVFPSMCDPFDNHPDLGPWRLRFFRLIRDTPHLTWLLLTKRPQNIFRLFTDVCGGNPDKIGGRTMEILGERWPRNAAIGFTAVTQPEMDRDAGHALRAFQRLPAPFLFWSGEPLFERVTVPDALLDLGPRFWAITGGESDQGRHRARPTPEGAFAAVRDQCGAAGAVFHHKQNGDAGEPGRLLDGVLHDARPVVLAR